MTHCRIAFAIILSLHDKMIVNIIRSPHFDLLARYIIRLPEQFRANIWHKILSSFLFSHPNHRTTTCNDIDIVIEAKGPNDSLSSLVRTRSCRFGLRGIVRVYIPNLRLREPPGNWREISRSIVKADIESR